VHSTDTEPYAGEVIDRETDSKLVKTHLASVDSNKAMVDTYSLKVTMANSGAVYDLCPQALKRARLEK
jgi:hypothetical protein